MLGMTEIIHLGVHQEIKKCLFTHIFMRLFLLRTIFTRTTYGAYERAIC